MGVASFDELIRKAWIHNAPSITAIDDVAVPIHTGGTTDMSKAVMFIHQGIASNVEQTKVWIPILAANGRVLCYALPFFHVFGTMAVILSVKLGTTTILLPKFNPHVLLTTNHRRSITLFPGVTPIFARILDATAECDEDLSGTGFVFPGVIALDSELAIR